MGPAGPAYWTQNPVPERGLQPEIPMTEPVPPAGDPSPAEFDLSTYPTSPGVYLMRDGKEKVIYVGKAKNLRSRLRSYFRDSGDGRPLLQFLRRRIASVETIVTTTEKEALLLENTLIKEHKPRYNIRLRDDKTYISLRLDLGHRWPRLHRIRRRIPGDSKGLYFGPYSSSQAVKETQRFLLSHFPIRSCSDHVLENRSRPCLLFQIGRCCAPCAKPVDPEYYRGLVEATALFLKGRREDVLRLLQGKMNEYSETLEFEKAAALRDRIHAIEETLEREQVVSHRVFDRDVIGLARDGGRVVFAVLVYREGRLRDSRTLDVRDLDLDDADLLEQFLSQFYDETKTVPRDLLLPQEPSNRDMVTGALQDQRGGPVRLRVPLRGRKRRLVEMADQNARVQLGRLLAGERTEEQVLDSLAAKLGLPARPAHIECFDISNIQGSMAVGSMVCFREGQPDKSNYRHFVIRSVEGSNDFAMMREVLERRYKRQIEEERPLPDLVLVDGGKGQLGVAQAVFEDLGLLGAVPLAAIAKSKLKPAPRRTVPGRAPAPRKRTEERIFLPGRKNPVLFRRGDLALFLLQRVRDESHRFGITFHRKLRSRSNLRSALDILPGIGKTRRKALLRHFGSLARLREASVDDIAAVPRMPRTVAETVYRFLHPAQQEFFPELIKDADRVAEEGLDEIERGSEPDSDLDDSDPEDSVDPSRDPPREDPPSDLEPSLFPDPPDAGSDESEGNGPVV